jgi:hypothetical protein
VQQRRADFGVGIVELHRVAGSTEGKYGIGLWCQTGQADHRCATQLLVLNQYGGFCWPSATDLACMSQSLYTVSIYDTSALLPPSISSTMPRSPALRLPSSYPNPLETQTSPSDSQNHRLPRSSWRGWTAWDFERSSPRHTRLRVRCHNTLHRWCGTPWRITAKTLHPASTRRHHHHHYTSGTTAHPKGVTLPRKCGSCSLLLSRYGTTVSLRYPLLVPPTRAYLCSNDRTRRSGLVDESGIFMVMYWNWWMIWSCSAQQRSPRYRGFTIALAVLYEQLPSSKQASRSSEQARGEDQACGGQATARHSNQQARILWQNMGPQSGLRARPRKSESNGVWIRASRSQSTSILRVVFGNHLYKATVLRKHMLSVSVRSKATFRLGIAGHRASRGVLSHGCSRYGVS